MRRFLHGLGVGTALLALAYVLRELFLLTPVGFAVILGTLGALLATWTHDPRSEKTFISWYDETAAEDDDLDYRTASLAWDASRYYR